MAASATVIGHPETIGATSEARLTGSLAAGVRIWATLIAVVGVLAAAAYVRMHRLGDAFGPAALVVCPLVGALVAVRRPANRIGWILLASGSAGVLGVGVRADRIVWLGPGAPSAAAAVGGDVLWPLGFPLLAVSLLWFPDGRLPSRRWRPVAATAVLVLAALVLAELTVPWTGPEHHGLVNPFASSAIHALLPFTVLLPMQTALVAAAIASVLVRYRTAEAEDRARIRWVAFAGAAGLIVVVGAAIYRIVGPTPAWVDSLLPAPIVAGVPVCMAIGVLRHRLFDIDLLLNRTALYAVLSTVLTGAYLTVLVVLGQVAGLDRWVPGAAAGLVLALAFQPVRVRVQRVADRRLFGDRSDPLAVLASVSGAGENAESPFEALVNAVAATLRLHYVALDLVEPDGLRRVAVHGTERGAPVVRIPLTWHGSDLGALLVAARSTRDPLRSTELALLAAVADQAAATVETRHLAETLQRSREQIVQAAEEERRRLRRDLHDGLGARLAAIGYELEAAARRPADASAQDVVRQAQSDLVNAVTELRRVIDDLRPGPLDDLGLAEALAGTARWLLEEAGVSAEISSTLPPALPLSAGTEIALFRIGVEAVANVVRHAHAMTCRVHLCLDGRVVVLRVCDDGRGPAKTHGELTNGYHRVGGLGIASMRDRAAELGGTLTIATGPVLGTTVEARVPIGLLQ